MLSFLSAEPSSDHFDDLADCSALSQSDSRPNVSAACLLRVRQWLIGERGAGWLVRRGPLGSNHGTHPATYSAANNSPENSIFYRARDCFAILSKSHKTLLPLNSQSHNLKIESVELKNAISILII